MGAQETLDKLRSIFVQENLRSGEVFPVNCEAADNISSEELAEQMSRPRTPASPYTGAAVKAVMRNLDSL